MSASLAWYQPGKSWLHRLDPRPKLLFTLCGTIVLVTLHSLPVVIGFLLLVHLALLAAGIPARRLLGVWRTLAPLLVFIVLVQPLLSPPIGTELFAWWVIRVTDYGIALALALALRLVAIGFCWYVLLMTTRQADLVQGLMRLGMPPAWGMVLALALRYPSTLQALYTTVLEAQRSRGLRLEGRGLLGRVRAQLPVLVAMLVASLRSIERLAMALESRGFGGPAPRTFQRPLRFGWGDWAAAAIVVGVSLAILVARVAWGWAADPLP